MHTIIYSLGFSRNEMATIPILRDRTILLGLVLSWSCPSPDLNCSWWEFPPFLETSLKGLMMPTYSGQHHGKGENPTHPKKSCAHRAPGRSHFHLLLHGTDIFKL